MANAGLIAGLGRGLQRASDVWIAMTQQKQNEERALREEAIRKALLDHQISRDTAAEGRAVRGEARADRAEEHDAVLEMLTNLPQPTKVGDDVAEKIKRIFPAFLSEEQPVARTLPLTTGTPRVGIDKDPLAAPPETVAPQALPLDKMNIAQPFETPAMKNAKLNNERLLIALQETNARDAANRASREGIAADSLSLRESLGRDVNDLRREANDIRRDVNDRLAGYGAPVNVIKSTNDKGEPVEQGIHRDGSIAWERPVVATSEQRNRTAAIGRINPFLTEVKELANKINVNAGIMATLKGGAELAKAKVNLANDTALYRSTVRGFTPMFARALGHVGVLTELDVERTESLLPSPLDNRELAERKIGVIGRILGGEQEFFFEKDTRLGGAGGPSAPAAKPAGPSKTVTRDANGKLVVQ